MGAIYPALLKPIDLKISDGLSLVFSQSVDLL